MTGLVVLVLSLGLTVIYLGGVGAVYIRVLRSRLAAVCPGCRGEKGNYYGQYVLRHHSHDGPYVQACLASAVWPAALVVILPAVFADPHRARLREEALQRRIRELEREAGIAA